MHKSRNHNFSKLAALIGLLWLLPSIALQSQTVALKLRNGDKITGKIISENTNQVVLGTSWAKEVPIPLVEIQSREIIPPPAPVVVTNVAPAAPATNAVPVVKAVQAPAAVAVGVPAPKTPVKPKPPSSWHGDAQLGADVGLSATRRELYYGRFKITYAPVADTGPNAKPRYVDRFRNTFDFNSAYGTVTTDLDHGRSRTDLSANRMDGTSKTDFDLGKKRKFFVYNLFGAGYDEIRKIDLRYELGPGIGYHVLARSNMVLNAEIGMNYQVQYLQDDTRTERFYYRFAEDFTWKISKTLTFDEKLELFPQVNQRDFRFRIESNLRYWLLENLSFNLTVLDLYDTQPAANVGNNDLQIRSSIGVKF